jgi:hypothetical protein
LAGILVFSTSGFGAVAVTISNSVVSNCTSASSNAGIDIEDIGTTILVSIDNVTASGNQTGIAGRGPATVLLGRSVITGNQYGVENSTSNNTFYTYKDNRISANTSGTDIRFSPLNGTVALQ